MMKLLTFAHRGEAQAFLSHFSFKPQEFYFDGLLKSEDAFLLITGEGPHTASEKTISVLTSYAKEISEVINIGIAGSLTTKYKLHDLIWVRTAYAHHAEKLEFKSFTAKDLKASVDCMTVFSRVLDKAEKQKLSLFANIIDRELWAIASAAHLFKKPFQALKIISDDLVNTDEDICKFVKEEAPLFSKNLLEEFLKKEFRSDNKAPTESLSPFTNNSLFYFTISQERKLQSLLEGLRLKGVNLEVREQSKCIEDIKHSEKIPKERSKILLQHLGDLLNPVSVKIRLALENQLSPLHEANIATSFDSDFEQDWLNLSMRIQSSRDLEKTKNALKIFSYEDYKKIFDGHFDV